MAIFLSLEDAVMAESFYLEALSSTPRCHTCGEHNDRRGNPPNSPTPMTPQELSPHSDVNVNLEPHLSTISEANDPTPMVPESDLPGANIDDVPTATPLPLPPPEPVFKCTMCGVFVECRQCCLERHRLVYAH